jgi:hypothetical protein
VSGREYRVYFYSTYINQFSKIKNDPKDEKSSDNNGNAGIEKRKRTEQTNNKTETKGNDKEEKNGEKNDDLESGIKKIKS